MATIYNTSGTPLIVDAEGHSVGAGEHRENVNTAKEPAKSHLADGRIVFSPLPEKDESEPSTKPESDPSVPETVAEPVDPSA